MSVIDIQSGAAAGCAPSAERQVAEITKENVKRAPIPIQTKGRKKVLHRVPGTLTREFRALIVSEFRGGRSAVQIGKVYNVAVDVVLELALRDAEARMRRAA